MQVKKRTFAGATCDQSIYMKQDNDGTRAISTSNPRPRFKNEEEREEHKRRISRRHHSQLINANFTPSSIYSTLTFDMENEIHDFDEAKKIRKNFYRVLKYAYPNAKISMYLGRGRSTSRIHIHMITDGIPIEFINKKWIYGEIRKHSYLREHNIDSKTGRDLGRDYTALADYLFDHWTREQGSGFRYLHSNNLQQPEEEAATECAIEYDEQHPPRPPKGYIYTGQCYKTKYGYMSFHYVVDPNLQAEIKPKRKTKRKKIRQ